MIAKHSMALAVMIACAGTSLIGIIDALTPVTSRPRAPAPDLGRVYARLQAIEEHITTQSIDVWDEDRSCVTTVTATVWRPWPAGAREDEWR